MKRYFLKKTLAWNIITAIVLGTVYFAARILLSTVLHFSDSVMGDRQISIIYVAVMTPITILLSVISGKFLADYLNRNSEYKGDFSKYQYLYYILSFIGSSAVDALQRLIVSIFKSVDTGENEWLSLLPSAINAVFGFIGIVVGVMCVRTFLCAVVQGGVAEKNYFSKAFIPLSASLICAVILHIISAVFFNADMFSALRFGVYAALFMGILALFRYKFEDEKIRKIACNILPFAYFGISAVFSVSYLIMIGQI